MQLIARVVEARANWRGLGSPRPVRSVRWIKALVWGLGGIAVGLGLWLGHGGITGRQTFDPLSDRDRALRKGMAVLAIAILAFWWERGRAVVGHILPVPAHQVGPALSAVALLPALAVLFPRDGVDTA